jgi:hypothetical protein
LFTPAAGEDLCSACGLLPSEPLWQAGGTSPGAAAKQPAGAASKRPGRVSAPATNFRGGRALRRIVIGAVGALLIAGLGVSVFTQRQTLTDTWTAVRRHTLSDSWMAKRRRTLSDSWIAMKRRTTEAWIAVRQYTPFDAPAEVKRSASVPPEPLAHRRTQAGAVKAKKRGRDE